MTQVVKLILLMCGGNFGSQSVSRVLYLCDHFSSPVITDGVKRPTRRLFRLSPEMKRAVSQSTYLILHLVGFTGFHYGTGQIRPVHTYFLLHFPSPRGARALPCTMLCGARTFLTDHHYNGQRDRPIGSQIFNDRLSAIGCLWPDSIGDPHLC